MADNQIFARIRLKHHRLHKVGSNIVRVAPRFFKSLALCSVITCSAQIILQEASLIQAQAQNLRVEQTLDPTHSAMRFSLASPLFQLAGKFNRYAGRVTLEGPNLIPIGVILKVDASEVNIDPPEGMEYLRPEALFRAIPNPLAVFTSTSITPINGNRYKVEGVVKKGGRTWSSQFTAVVVKRSESDSEFYIHLSGPVLDFADELPLPMNKGRSEGSLDAKLHFSTQKALNNSRVESQKQNRR